VAHACNPRTRETEVGEPDQAEADLGYLSQTLSQINHLRKERKLLNLLT
jgi:hypothetical protein